MGAVQALNAVRCTHAELNSVRLLACWAELTCNTFRTIPTRRADITLRVGGVCCPTCFASHARSARSARKAVSVLIELVWVVAHQTLRPVGRRCRSTRAPFAGALPTRMSICTLKAAGMHRIRLFPVRAGATRDAVRTVLADGSTVAQHLIHTWIARAPSSGSAEWTRGAAIVCAAWASSVRTHITSHKVVGKASIRYA